MKMIDCNTLDRSDLVGYTSNYRNKGVMVMQEDPIAAEVLKLREEGAGIAQIARTLKKGNAYVSKVLKDHGKYGKPYYMTNDEKAEAIRLRRSENISSDEIAKRLGRSKYAVLEVLKKAKLEARQIRPIIVKCDEAEIELTRGAVTKIDADDVMKISGMSWFLTGGGARGYAAARQNNKFVYLHRLLLDAPVDMHVDHVNGDSLDNRRENLRLATPQQNAANTNRKIGKSGFIGVKEHKGGKFFSAVQINLGTFDTAEDAARAYDEKVTELFGEFAMTNKGRGLLK